MGAEKTRLEKQWPEGVENPLMDLMSYPNELCPAKVNLILRVGARRSDGFHEIETLMVKTTWGDRLSLKVRRAEKTLIDLQTPGFPLSAEKNLVYRAAKAFSEAFRLNFEARFVLKKVVPTGAGLGGGSSDAAKALELLARWAWGNRHQRSTRLMKLAGELGADIPFFLGGGASWCTGFGERLTEARIPKLWLVLVLPKEEVETAWAYRILDEDRRGKKLKYLNGKPGWLGGQYSVPELENDFETVVLKFKPRLRSVRSAIAESGAIASVMSGSGSSFFGLYTSERDSKRAAHFLRNRGFRAIPTASE
jgi:4-diphosphocytidyl-2-C-methyl-D-erythritol kinase